MNESFKLSLKNCVDESEEGVKVILNVKPKSRVEDLKFEFKELVFCTKTPPVKGKANTALIKFLSKVFEVPSSAIERVSGHREKSKIVKVKGISKDIAIRKLINYLSKSQ